MKKSEKVTNATNRKILFSVHIAKLRNIGHPASFQETEVDGCFHCLGSLYVPVRLSS